MKILNRVISLGVFLLPMFVVVPACTTQQRVKTETSLAKTLVSDAQSEQIGDQVHAELDAKGTRFITDRSVTGYVEGIASPVFRQAKEDRPGVEYHLHIIDDPKTVNAFATPGGHVYVYSGLLLAAENEAEVAGVLAHEAGHISGRHVERAMVNAYGLQTLAGVALGQSPSTTQKLAADLAGTGVMLAHSRSEETEADEYGATYVSHVGYDPHAMITFFQKLQANEGSSPRAMVWLRSHPLTQDRIDHLKRYIRDNRLSGTEVGEQRYESFRKTLGR